MSITRSNNAGTYKEGQCVGYENLTFDDTAGGAALASIPDGANRALFTVECDAGTTDTSQVVRFREDGTAPTTSEGFSLGKNDAYEIKGIVNITNFKIIAIENLTQSIKVLYFR